jgi:ADP-heptose:LPS heptosyltransferase
MKAVSSALRDVRACLFLLLDSICALMPRRTGDVVVVLRLDAVGDFFIWMQSGAHEVSRFAHGGGGRVVLVANRTWAAYAASTGMWDEVIGMDPVRFVRDPLYRVRILLRIRRLGADLLIQPRAGRVFLQEDEITRVCGARTRIGNTGTLINVGSAWRRLGNTFYTRVIHVSEDRAVHETVRNAQFVSGLTGETPERRKLDVSTRPANNAPSVVVALGAGQSGRVWPVEKLTAVIGHVLQEHAAHRVQLYGLRSDEATARRLQSRFPGRLEDFVGKTELSEFVAAIAGARLVICNDSSAFHIAMACGSPVVCFLGGGHYGWFAPYPDSAQGSASAVVLSVQMDCFWCNWRCRYKRAAEGALLCVASIPVEPAIQAVDRLLRPAGELQTVTNAGVPIASTQLKG